MVIGECQHCGGEALVAPLHLEKGGPAVCIPCGMKWRAEWTRVRKLERIVVKALKAYFDVGGKSDNETLNRLRLAAWGISLGGIDNADTLGAEVGDITLELLDDVVELTHPDVHPPERREKANRVTREMLLLRPYVFPAPVEKRRNDFFKSPPDDFKDPLQEAYEEVTAKLAAYPCKLCRDTWPGNYCGVCRPEWERRSEKGRELERAKQRAWYRARRDRERERWATPRCKACGKRFERKRIDAQYCSGACRQRAHRSKGTGPAPFDPRKRTLDVKELT